LAIARHLNPIFKELWKLTYYYFVHYFVLPDGSGGNIGCNTGKFLWFRSAGTGTKVPVELTARITVVWMDRPERAVRG